MSLVSARAVLVFFRNMHCIIVGRYPAASAHVNVPSDRKKCVVNAVRLPALRGCSAFGISGADMGVFPLMDVPAFGRWEIFGKRCAPVVFQLSAGYSYGARGHTLSVVFYGHGMIGAVLHRLSPLEINVEVASFGGLNMHFMSVRLRPSPRFVVLNGTVSRAISLANCPSCVNRRRSARVR